MGPTQPWEGPINRSPFGRGAAAPDAQRLWGPAKVLNRVGADWVVTYDTSGVKIQW
jgi:hypothetical protein